MSLVSSSDSSIPKTPLSGLGFATVFGLAGPNSSRVKEALWHPERDVDFAYQNFKLGAELVSCLRSSVLSLDSQH